MLHKLGAIFSGDGVHLKPHVLLITPTNFLAGDGVHLKPHILADDSYNVRRSHVAQKSFSITAMAVVQTWTGGSRIGLSLAAGHCIAWRSRLASFCAVDADCNGDAYCSDCQPSLPVDPRMGRYVIVTTIGICVAAFNFH
jgi:hypothetical protein